jgi:uncharacterized protein YqeY
VTLSEKLQQDLTQAIRDRDELRRDALRMAIAAANGAAKSARRPLSDEELIAVLAREIKTRRETIDSFAAAGRAATAASEQAKLNIVAAYMPAQLAEDELLALVTQAIDETGASSAREMGKVMAAVMPKVRGRADGKQVNALVARELARRDVAEHGH